MPLGSKILALAQRLISIVEVVVMYVAAILLIIWFVPEIRTFLEDHHVISEHELISILGLAAIVLVRNSEEIRKSQNRLLRGEEARIIEHGATGLYTNVDPLIDNRPAWSYLPRRRRTLEVLGLTLFSAWPHLRGKVISNDFTDWNITLYCVDPEHMRNRSEFSSKWLNDAKTRSDDIKKFVEDNQSSLKQRRVAITLVLYRSLPAIHGWRIDGNHVFVSIIRWGTDGQLEDPYSFYDYFPASDKSLRSQEYRDLFENWVARARQARTE